MPFQQFTSEENLTKSLPSDFRRIPIASLTLHGNLKSLYIRANVFKKFKLNTFRVSSIKFILQDDNGNTICLHAFGDIATRLDSCSVGDTLFLLEFEVEIAPKQSSSRSRCQLIADDRVVVKPIVWVLKNNVDISSQVASSGSTESGKKAEALKPSYVYTLLKDLKINEKFNVYGVVTHLKEIAQTRSDDKHLMLNITDQSMPSKDSILTCNLFHSDAGKLPAQAQVGDVIRFHRLKIQSYGDKLQAISGPGFHWLCFHGSFEDVSSSSSNYTLENQDKEKVRALFEWSQSYMNEAQTILDAAEPSPDVDQQKISTPSLPSSPVPSTSKDGDDRKSVQRTPMKESSSYQTLRDVKVGTEANVFGVVIYLKPLMTTIRSQFHQMMNITDQSLLNKDDKLTCNLFNSDQNKLPYIAEVGDVIRLKKLKIQLFQGKTQGNGTIEWALFRGSSEQPFASSGDFTPNVQEKAVVEGLMKWWQEGPESISFSQSTPRKYFNIVCQVIGVYLEPDKTCRVVRVWDGTAFNGPILKRTDAEMNHGMRKDNSLETRAGDLATDLFLFDNHATSSESIQPGDVIKVTNLHANVVSGKIEMTLHGGTKYNKGYMQLDRGKTEAKNLLAALKSLSPQEDETPSPQKKSPGKRHLDEDQPDDSLSPGKKPCTRSNTDERNDSRRTLGDSINWNNTSVAEVFLAKEYDDISQSAELSQCDRLAVEALLIKKQTSKEDNPVEDKNAAQAGPSMEAKADESQHSVSSSQGDRENPHNDNGNCNKRLDQDCDIIEGTDESSSEESPSIFLSMYNSPTSVGMQEQSTNEEEGNAKGSPSGCRKGISKPVGKVSSTDCNDEPPETHGNPSQPKSRTWKLKESSQSEAPIKIIEKDNTNDNAIPKLRIQYGLEENVSSQESFITASEGLSPQKNRTSQCVNLAGSSTPAGKSSKLFLTLRPKGNQFSEDNLGDASGSQESDNTISSSQDFKYVKSKSIAEACGVSEESEVTSSTESKGEEHSNDTTDALAEDEPLQCMLETATAVVDHPKVKRTKLSEVLHHKVPHKFKILVRMMDYKPRPTCGGDLVHFCCHICKYMIKASDMRAPAIFNKEKICPKCTQRESVLQPVIVMKFLLSDGRYDLVCHLWKSHAVQFFQGMEPLDLLANEDSFTEVQHHLDKLCPANTEFTDKPFMECCVFSYHVKRKVNYQMFDTVVI